MKKGYIYTTFFMLTTLVIISLVFAFKYVKTPPNNDFNTNDITTVVDIKEDKVYTQIQKSWLKDIKDEYSKASYFYAQTQIQLELN